jgi:ABC-type glycerol-3-phosphate transport system permease component
VGILLLQSDVGWEYGRAAAAAMIVMFPTLLLALILHKQLIRGLMAGGVKG